MASTTTNIGLIKPAENEFPDVVQAVNDNMNTLDEEVWKRGKTFNGEEVGADGGFHINSIPYAENLETSSSQKSDDSYIMRTTGGDASIADEGDAWLISLRGTMRHENYVPQSITMSVIPMARQADPEITATLDAETFEAYVVEYGTYTLTYNNGWDHTPSDYGVTVTNTPINGDSITIVWGETASGETGETGETGEDVPEPVMTVNAVPRPVPASISATIDEETFVSYVTQSGTITLTYSTSWSADPANYGITVTGTPIAGDVITVVYIKEVRGIIYQSNPQTFVSTGWNLYDHTNGYARLIKYSSESGYGFKISGTYTALEFATTVSGTRTTITPVSGYFTIPNDGYLFVAGGNTTDTQVWMTWSDWTSTANGGTFEAYKYDSIDLSTFMSEYFPYGLMAVGTAADEINLNVGVATSNVIRQAYNSTNLENAKASGRQYEYDENYIYIERAAPTTYPVSIDGDFTANDHGMEYFTGTEQAVYAQTIYGANLKNKLERDVLTISQQTLTTAQQDQICENLGINRSTMRVVPFAIATTDWTGNSSPYTATFLTSYITSASVEEVIYDSSIASYAKAHISSAKKSGGGGLVFTSAKKGTGTITGNILVWANDDGKLPVLIEDTVTPIANGGTGQSSLAGAKQALGITALSEVIENLKGNKFATVSDYNLFKTTEVLQARADANALNPPDAANPGRWYSLFVWAVGPYVTQIAHSVTNNKLYIRGYYNNVWTAWREI